MINITPINPWLLIILPSTNIVHNHNRLLIVLLNLELISITLILIIALNLLLPSHTEFISLLVLVTVSTCEASALLTCLVLINRKFSSDNLHSMMSGSQ